MFKRVRRGHAVTLAANCFSDVSCRSCEVYEWQSSYSDYSDIHERSVAKVLLVRAEKLVWRMCCQSEREQLLLATLLTIMYPEWLQITKTPSTCSL